MQARGLLMVEHRLIEKLIRIVETAMPRMRVEGRADPVFVDTVVDFIRTYADRTHHGKEEDILFRDLAQRPLSADDRKAMNELIVEHAMGRKLTAEIVAANARYRDGDTSAFSVIVDNLQQLAVFYPIHIEKEDKAFFPAARQYFTDEEDHDMIHEFYAFDRRMIHEKYKAVVAGLRPPESAAEKDAP